jgi:GT2 family glycosyltransferase
LSGHTGETVDLVCLDDPPQPTTWPLGRVLSGGKTPKDLEQQLGLAAHSNQPDAWLFWNYALGNPDPAAIENVLKLPGELWHAGLQLGMGGLPGAIDFVAPTWLLNRDPAPNIEATSWRVSLRACLVRRVVLEQMGFIRSEFHSLEAAALEWGHRCIRQGVIMRHVPSLLSAAEPEPAQATLSLEDELRFVLYRFGRKWVSWAVLRAILSGYASLGEAFNVWQRLRWVSPPPVPQPFQHPSAITNNTVRKSPERVTVLIPTLERYGYLRNLLAQLQKQTLPPDEIIVVDQTEVARRQPDVQRTFPDLPLRWFYRDEPGQCSSRNAGLQAARGELILFLDDDDDVPEDLVETLVASMRRYCAEAISGVAHETGAGPLPDDFTYLRASDVFPTNNTLLQRTTLRRSGLFDLAYERGARADGDLGMRVYLNGALMVLDPAATVIHHHAPSGGLRSHQARLITYASSRTRLTHRHLAGVTEIYLARRYFSPRQVQEMLWLNVLGTFSMHGGWVARLTKAVVGAVLLPDTLLTLRRRQQQAVKMMNTFPLIPELEEK